MWSARRAGKPPTARVVRSARAPSAVLLTLALLTAGCLGGTSATPRQTATPQPTELIAVSPPFTPIPNGGPTGRPIASTAEFGDVLGPGDFAAVGLPDAQAPTVNTTGCTNCAFIVFKGRSAADGGYELDIFRDDSVEEADNDFGGMTTDNMKPLSPELLEQLGADKASFDASVEGNTETTKFASLLVQDGRVVFSLGIPAGPGAQAQILALAKAVLSRVGPLV